MATLTTKKRNRLRKSSFALPSQRRYPIHDISHARNALARSAREKPGTRRYIRSRVYKKYPSLRKR